MTKIVNSSAGNDYFQVNGSAISDTAQPDLEGGSVAGVDTNSIINRGFVGYEPATVNRKDVYQSGTDKILGTSVATTPSANQDGTPDMAMQSMRTRKVATAIRNDQWVPYSGVFSPAPSVSNDASATSLASDNAATFPNKSRATFGLGSTTPTTKEIG